MSQEDGKKDPPPHHPDVLPPGVLPPRREGEVIGAGMLSHPDVLATGTAASIENKNSVLNALATPKARKEFLQAMRAQGKSQKELVETYSISAKDEGFYFSSTEGAGQDVVDSDDAGTAQRPRRTPRKLGERVREEPYFWPDFEYEHYLPNGGKTRGPLTPSEYIRAWDEGRLPWIRNQNLRKPDHYPTREQALKAKIKK